MTFSFFSLIIYFLIAAIGFMTAYVYKHSITTVPVFSPNPRKTLQIFLTVFFLACLLTFFLSYYTAHSLENPVIPEDNSMQFQSHKSMMMFSLNVSFFMLVILSNVYSLSVRKLTPVPYILTIGFYVLFTLKDAYYVSGYYVIWQESLRLLKGDIPDFQTSGWIKCLLGAGVTAFNALMIWWGLRK